MEFNTISVLNMKYKDKPCNMNFFVQFGIKNGDYSRHRWVTRRGRIPTKNDNIDGTSAIKIPTIFNTWIMDP